MVRHAERWLRMQHMEDMAKIVGRTRDVLVNEAIDEWLLNHEEEYRQREKRIREHLKAIKAIQK